MQTALMDSMCSELTQPAAATCSQLTQAAAASSALTQVRQPVLLGPEHRQLASQGGHQQAHAQQDAGGTALLQACERGGSKHCMSAPCKHNRYCGSGLRPARALAVLQPAAAAHCPPPSAAAMLAAAAPAMIAAAATPKPAATTLLVP